MEKVYYSVDSNGELICQKCNLTLEEKTVRFAYMGNAFPVELPVCPKCNFIYVPEELALGRVLSVEKSLEDK